MRASRTLVVLALLLLVPACADGDTPVGGESPTGEPGAAVPDGSPVDDADDDAGDDGSPPAATADEPTVPETASPTASPSPTAARARANPRPELVVVNATGGELQVRDAGDGSVVRVLATFDDPDEHDGPVAAGTFLDEVRRDGDRVLFTTCCEPAFGVVEEIPVGGGERRRVAGGTSPALSPGGTLAVVQGQEVVIDPGTASERRLSAADPPGRIAHLTFGPDGRLLAGVWNAAGEDGLEPDEVFVLDLASADSLDDAVRHEPAGADTAWTAPAFRSDGRLVVAEQPARPEEGDRSTGVVIDPLDGTELARFPLGGLVASQRYDATGTYLLTVSQFGSLEWRGAGGGGLITAGGILDAAW